MLFTYMPHSKFSNLLTLEQWAFEYAITFILIRTVYRCADVGSGVLLVNLAVDCLLALFFTLKN